MNEPEQVTVHWTGQNVEIKLLNAMDGLFRKAFLEGLSASGARRVRQYLAAVEDFDASDQPAYFGRVND